MSGAPYNRFFFDPVYRRFGAFRAQRGYDNRGTLIPDDDRPLRLPDFSQLDLQVRLSLEPLIKQRIELWVDALNILALRTTDRRGADRWPVLGADPVPPASHAVAVRSAVPLLRAMGAGARAEVSPQLAHYFAISC